MIDLVLCQWGITCLLMLNYHGYSKSSQVLGIQITLCVTRVCTHTHTHTHANRQLTIDDNQRRISQQPIPEEDPSRLPDIKTVGTCSDSRCDPTERLIQLSSNSTATNKTTQEHTIPLVFSHLEHATSVTVINQNICNCAERLPRLGESQLDSVCRNCGLTKQHQSSTEQDIIESFNSMHVSNTTTGAQSMPTGMSCRQQAAAYDSRYFDDTTVDELAGYFDEIMYLPRPMSEMAELMYT